MVGELAVGRRTTLGADKAYDAANFVAEMRRLGVTPHVSQNTNGRRSPIYDRTTRHPGYAISVRVRKISGMVRQSSSGSIPNAIVERLEDIPAAVMATS
jgi:hypothetical protein